MSAASQYYSVTARVGVPHRHEVEVTVPLVGPAGATGPAGAAGASAWNDITGKPSTFAPSAHASTHHTTGSDPLTPANIGAAKDFTEIEVGNSGTSTTTLTTAQLPARVILFIDAATAPSATINLPTPDARQSGLVASIKVQVEGGTADTALITVVHSAVNLLSAYSLAEDEGTIDFRWDGYRWVYDANWLLRSSTGRVLELPTTSGTLALTENADSTFRIVGSADATKKVAFEVDGLSSGTTRTLTVPNSSGTIALLETLPAGGTKTYAVFTAEHNQPPASNYATLDTRNSIAVLDFDAATDENAVFVGIMPEAASLGSGLIVRLHWMATSATSGNVRWGVQFERSNTDLDADSFDTAVEATAATNGTSGIITTTAITVTTIDGITAGDVFRLKVYRNADDATNDTMTGDAELVAVEVRSAA